jgi:hypothetical protein
LGAESRTHTIVTYMPELRALKDTCIFLLYVMSRSPILGVVLVRD